MLTIKNVRTIEGQIRDLQIKSPKDFTLDVKGALTALPALVDPHVHFRVPGQDYKENWVTGSKASISGGVTTVFDMPNNVPACVTKEGLLEKMKLIDAQLPLPLRYKLFLGASKDHLNEIERCRDLIVGVKIFMGCSTGNLLIDDDETLEEIFRLGAKHNVLIAIHAEDECLLKANKAKFANSTNPADHSKIRNREVAIAATKKALGLAKKHGTKLYLLHIGTKEEVELIRQAKVEGVNVFMETTPQYLFLTEDDYGVWGTKVQMNPPLRTHEDQKALWKAIHDGVVDTIGTDHAPHTLEEKALPFGQAPSGIPGVETMLPLLLNACHEGKITLQQLVKLTSHVPQKVFNLEVCEDWVLVDLQKSKTLKDTDLKTRCGWSPYTGRTLKGWPEYTILKGEIYRVADL